MVAPCRQGSSFWAGNDTDPDERGTTDADHAPSTIGVCLARSVGCGSRDRGQLSEPPHTLRMSGRMGLPTVERRERLKHFDRVEAHSSATLLS